MTTRADAPAAALTGAQVRAHRILGSGLARDHTRWPDLPVWRIGLQDRDGSARAALAARLPADAPLPEFEDPAGTGWPAMAWSLRGAPHLHPREDLERFAAALWPADERDAAARLLGDTKRLAASGAAPVESYAAVSAAMREVITSPMTKGAASAAVTAALPERFSGFCRPCGSVHVREMLFRVSALPAGIGLVPDTKPVVLAPLSDAFGTPNRQRGLAGIAGDCLRAFGVATPGDVAAHLGTSAAALRPALPDDLVAVTVDGARSQAREADLDDILGADLDRAAAIVRLLPPFDPLLQPRDRSVLAADRAEQKALWPVIGTPGAVLAGGAIVGLWRTRAAGQAVTITVTPWRRLSGSERAALADEAQLVGRARGVPRLTLVIAE